VSSIFVSCPGSHDFRGFGAQSMLLILSGKVDYIDRCDKLS
jgi:hypothetical protein